MLDNQLALLAFYLASNLHNKPGKVVCQLTLNFEFSYFPGWVVVGWVVVEFKLVQSCKQSCIELFRDAKSCVELYRDAKICAQT